VNFTREPIIETIITPKDGYKLVVRNSKGGNQEEFSVDAVEVVSFGHSFFFRSLEKPRSFLVPASDYEVLEVKETRVVLKNASPEQRAIKIGGGREAPRQQPREPMIVEEEEISAETGISEAPSEQRHDKKRDRHRRRRRRGSEDRHRAPEEQNPSTSSAPEADQGGGAHDETQVSSSMFSKLFPPPTTLISQTISRYKDKDAESAEGSVLPQQVEAPKKEQEEDPGTGEAKHLHRVSSFTPSDDTPFII
jgi:hypothetical protein